jgi:nitrogen regulatory protein P-II 1
MKWVVAIVRPNRLEVVKDLLGKGGFHGLTVTDVQGVGRQRGHTEVYRGHEYKVDLISKVKLEIAVSDENVDKLVDLLVRAGRTGEEGQIGDGKIFVIPLEEAVRIRTGEGGEAAL